MLNGNLKLAVQKKGRLTEKSLLLLRNCGLDIEDYSERLIITTRNFELDLLFLRDDDIPEYVQDGVADIGIVGEDVVKEKRANVDLIRKLGFGRCRLSLAIPENKNINTLGELNGQRIATSFPNLLRDYLEQNKINAKVVEISGSVEIAPSLGVADLICDLVSTGNTLKLNKLKKSFDVFSAEAVLIGTGSFPSFPESVGSTTTVSEQCGHSCAVPRRASGNESDEPQYGHWKSTNVSFTCSALILIERFALLC